MLAALLVGCGDNGTAYRWHIGDTTVHVHNGAQAWPDLPEALLAMQLTTDAPDAVWRVEMHLWPAGQIIPEAQPEQRAACMYTHNTARVDARVTQGPSTADDCLPHELAHRWRVVKSGIVKHDAVWKFYEQQLRAAAKTTWMHPKP